MTVIDWILVLTVLTAVALAIRHLKNHKGKSCGSSCGTCGKDCPYRK